MFLKTSTSCLQNCWRGLQNRTLVARFHQQGPDPRRGLSCGGRCWEAAEGHRRRSLGQCPQHIVATYALPVQAAGPRSSLGRSSSMRPTIPPLGSLRGRLDPSGSAPLLLWIAPRRGSEEGPTAAHPLTLDMAGMPPRAPSDWQARFSALPLGARRGRARGDRSVAWNPSIPVRRGRLSSVACTTCRRRRHPVFLHLTRPSRECMSTDGGVGATMVAGRLKWIPPM